MDAANVPSHMVDPLAVPSLRRVLQQGLLVEHYAIDGLERIGNREAIAGLKAAQYHTDEDVRAAVRLALTQLQETSRRPLRPAD
jgi:HEAT repeat protein